jgi:hypothetical protein
MREPLPADDPVPWVVGHLVSYAIFAEDGHALEVSTDGNGHLVERDLGPLNGQVKIDQLHRFTAHERQLPVLAISAASTAVLGLLRGTTGLPTTEVAHRLRVVWSAAYRQLRDLELEGQVRRCGTGGRGGAVQWRVSVQRRSEQDIP